MNKSYLLILTVIVAGAILYNQESNNNDQASITNYLSYLKTYSKVIPNG